MNQKAVLIAMLVLAAGACTTRETMSTAEKKPKKCETDILYVGPEKPCAKALATEIHSNKFKNLGKCKRVRWWVDGALGYSWEIQYKSGAGELENPGPYEIPSDKNTIESAKAKKAGDWYYEVVVKDRAGRKLCSTDPLIVIKE